MNSTRPKGQTCASRPPETTTSRSPLRVRAMVGHNLGNIEAAASIVETVRQQARAARRAKREAISSLDAMTAVQVDDRAGLAIDELLEGVERREEFVNPWELEPLYLRRPDAVANWTTREPRGQS